LSGKQLVIWAFFNTVATTNTGDIRRDQFVESTCSIPCRLPASMHATGYGYVSRMCKGNYVVPLLTAGYDMLHLEARYNHEEFHTASLWRSHCSAVAFRGRYVAADARYRNQQQLRSRCLHRLRRHEL